MSHVAIRHALPPGDLRERLGATTRELLEPFPATNDRLDERRIDSATVRVPTSSFDPVGIRDELRET